MILFRLLKKFLFAFLILLFVVPFVISNNLKSTEVHAATSWNYLIKDISNYYVAKENGSQYSGNNFNYKL